MRPTLYTHSIPAENLALLLDDLDGLPVKISRGFTKDIARVYFKRKHMKRLMQRGVDTARYYR